MIKVTGQGLTWNMPQNPLDDKGCPYWNGDHIAVSCRIFRHTLVVFNCLLSMIVQYSTLMYIYIYIYIYCIIFYAHQCSKICILHPMMTPSFSSARPIKVIFSHMPTNTVPLSNWTPCKSIGLRAAWQILGAINSSWEYRKYQWEFSCGEGICGIQ